MFHWRCVASNATLCKSCTGSKSSWSESGNIRRFHGTDVVRTYGHPGRFELSERMWYLCETVRIESVWWCYSAKGFQIILSQSYSLFTLNRCWCWERSEGFINQIPPEGCSFVRNTMETSGPSNGFRTVYWNHSQILLLNNITNIWASNFWTNKYSNKFCEKITNVFIEVNICSDTPTCSERNK